MKKIMMFVFIGLLLCSAEAFAITSSIYPFTSFNKRHQFYALISQLRCLVCQNETLAASTASLAADLREQVYHLVVDGKSNKQIKHYLVTRYGDFVLYKPPLGELTYFLWFGPFILLGLGVIILVMVLRRQSKAHALSEMIK